MDGAPAFGNVLVSVFVFFGRMQDRDADDAVRIDVRVKKGRGEGYAGG